MNQFQLAMPPGSPEAKRSYCSCPGWTPSVEWDENHKPLRMHYSLLLNPDCTLHAARPEFQLPDSI